ncbi:anti-sigma factor family protein [Scleromatobacter humisilvae]|uniref:Anti-sigma factor n=1 Tax=Scleromatobacter humisilvae TaxID=2897159 RepID=A0A9X1YR68_9BURK|nr:anti-sigma factor [Scleromatobacter humisilvae]MCK9686916.1 anti-sigma factor [Scleromatobacter humisilvae]
MTDAFPPPPSGPDIPVTEAELHAYADRQLTAERSAEVAAWLARRPDEAARVRAWEYQKRELRGLFDPVLDEAVPATLRRRARGGAGWRRAGLAAAAGLVLALAAGGTGWALRGAQDAAPLAAAQAAANDFAARAAIAHTVYTPEIKRPVEVDGAHEDQLVTWLSKRMGAPMKAPHLQSLGYELEGGRLLPGDRGPVAQFMYRDAAFHRLTLYVSNEKPSPATHGLANADLRAGDAPRVDTAFRFVSEGPVNVFWWMDGPFRYAITAAADRAALTQVSAEVYRQLEPQRP